MRKRHCGFTLIEMLLALALTSLLTAALSAMIGQAAREREAMREQTHDPAWAGQLIDLLEHDLQHAHWWAGAKDRVVLIGLGRDGLPAQIEYQWREYEQANILTRKQVSLTEGVGGRYESRKRVVGIDLQGIRVGPYGFGVLGAEDQVTVPAQLTDRSQPTLLIDGRKVSLQLPPEQIAIRLLLHQGHEGTSPSREVILR